MVSTLTAHDQNEYRAVWSPRRINTTFYYWIRILTFSKFLQTFSLGHIGAIGIAGFRILRGDFSSLESSFQVQHSFSSHHARFHSRLSGRRELVFDIPFFSIPNRVRALKSMRPAAPVYQLHPPLPS